MEGSGVTVPAGDPVSGDLTIALGGYTSPPERGRFRSAALWLSCIIAAIIVAALIGFYFYWQNMKSTPQYSLAVIVDAAGANDEPTVNRLVDIDAVVDDFLPQITDKAVELYGRGMPADVIRRVEKVAAPVMPAVKERARAELPGAIRQKTNEFGSVPFAAMVLGADTYLDIGINGDDAVVRSRLPEHDFEVRMRRDGRAWKIVGLTDQKLATTIARRVGQDILAIATNSSSPAKTRLGVKNINELLNEAEEIFK